jgi:acyl dehydratase
MSESTPRLPELRARIGEDLGQSEWFTIGQREVDVFSALTDDWDYMHNDPEWAASRSWGGTIAHGLYVLSLTPSMLKMVCDLPLINADPQQGFTLNYGYDKVRFIGPVRVGVPMRCTVNLVSMEDRDNGNVLLKLGYTFEQEGRVRPVVYAEHLLYMDYTQT